MRVAAGIFIFNDKKEFLVEHPTGHKPTFWSVPKGVVEKDEDYYNAAKRETLEETALDIDSIAHEFVCELPEFKINNRKKVILFVLKTSEDLSNYPFKCDSMVTYMRGKPVEYPFPECDDFKWVTIKEGLKLLHHSQVAALQHIIDNNII